jgi:hypothetical protein
LLLIPIFREFRKAAAEQKHDVTGLLAPARVLSSEESQPIIE